MADKKVYDELYYWRDLGFCAQAEVFGHQVKWKVYWYNIHDKPLLDSASGGTSSADITDSLEPEEVYLHGDVKWDGCSNWFFDAQDGIMLHFCDRESVMNIGALLGRLYDFSSKLMPQHQERFNNREQNPELLIYADWLEERGHAQAAADLRTFDKLL